MPSTQKGLTEGLGASQSVPSRGWSAECVAGPEGLLGVFSFEFSRMEVEQECRGERVFQARTKAPNEGRGGGGPACLPSQGASWGAAGLEQRDLETRLTEVPACQTAAFVLGEMRQLGARDPEPAGP